MSKLGDTLERDYLPDEVRVELEEIKATLAGEELAQVHFGDLLEPRLLAIVGLGVFLAVFQQWCGINVIFNYAQEVFLAAGYEVSALMFSIVITGIVNLLFTFVATTMFFRETVDRREVFGIILVVAGIVLLVLWG